MKKTIPALLLLLALLFPTTAWAAAPEIPDYDGELTVELNHNTPGFTPEERVTENHIAYSELDALGRSGPATACLSREDFPTTLRGEIASALPSGWVTARYEGLIDGAYLYTRCHLIPYELGGLNDDVRNFLTGTRFFNAEGLHPYEQKVAAYLRRTTNHVLYRVTPVYDGEALVAKGVQLEAYSVEDSGKTVCFNVFVYNVQPGVLIDYDTGDSERDPDYAAAAAAEAEAIAAVLPAATADAAAETPAPTHTPRPLISLQSLTTEHTDAPLGTTYVLDKKTYQFHNPTCTQVDEIYNYNKEYFSGTRDEALLQGYNPCSICNP